MDDTDKDIMILLVLAEQGGGLTANQIAVRTVMYQASIPVRDVSTRLMHLKARKPSYVIQDLRKPQEWHITKDGMNWAVQNRRK